MVNVFRLRTCCQAPNAIRLVATMHVPAPDHLHDEILGTTRRRRTCVHLVWIARRHLPRCAISGSSPQGARAHEDPRASGQYRFARFASSPPLFGSTHPAGTSSTRRQRISLRGSGEWDWLGDAPSHLFLQATQTEPYTQRDLPAAPAPRMMMRTPLSGKVTGPGGASKGSGLAWALREAKPRPWTLSTH